MVEPASSALELNNTYLQLSDGAAVVPVPVDPEFWQRIEERTELHSGRLLTWFVVSKGWTHWEMHPAGDEILILTGGAATVVLRQSGRDTKIALRAGTGCIVPQGAWHTLEVHEPGVLIAITRGAGTEHKANPHTDEEDNHG